MQTIKLLIQLFRRAKSHKNTLLLSIMITVVTIFFAVFFTAKFEIKGNIALVTHGQPVSIQESKYLHITNLNQSPPFSALVMHKYDAVVTERSDGTFAIQTLKDQAFQQELVDAFRHPKTQTFASEATRGIGTNIMGYLVMFVLLHAILFMNFFAEDKKNGTLKRILTSPVSIGNYLLAHCIYNFMMVMVPTFLVIVVAKEFAQIQVGLQLLQYVVGLSLISFLSTAFALCINALMDNQDNANMLSSSIILLTSILSGTFYSFKTKSVIMRDILNVLPQKHFLELVQGMENGRSILESVGQLAYVLGFAGILLLIGMIVCRRRWKEGRYS